MLWVIDTAGVEVDPGAVERGGGERASSFFMIKGSNM